jgi:hypothetical protein
MNRMIKREPLKFQRVQEGIKLYSNYNDDIRIGTFDTDIYTRKALGSLSSKSMVSDFGNVYKCCCDIGLTFVP